MSFHELDMPKKHKFSTAKVSGIPDDILALADEVTLWRRYLHANPETAFEEVNTARFIAEKLRSFGGIEVFEGIGGTGVVGVLNGQAAGPSIGLRADIDALDISETNDFPWSSTVPGKMHACGHDGHTAMLLGAAKYLATRRHFNGRVVFIFQPAEENEGGARVMIEQGLFDKFPVDRIFGLHNRPGLPEGHMAFAPGPVMAGYDLFQIVIKGKGGHAAKPNLTIDPIVISSHVILALQSIVSRMADPAHALVVSCTQINGGEAINAIPANVTIAGTVRCFDPDIQEMAKQAIKQIAEATAHAHGANAVVNYEHRYPPTINDPIATDEARQAALAVLDVEKITVMVPGTGSEDFAFMLQKKPGSYCLLGTGDGASVHNPAYDFNDRVLPHGIAYWVSIIDSLCD